GRTRNPVRRPGGGGNPPPPPARLGHDAGLRPEAAARAAECFAVIPLCLCRAVSGRTRRLLMRPNVGAVQERHAERNLARLRRLAPLSCRQMIASIVRRRSWCCVLPRGRHASMSGPSAAHCASVKTTSLSLSAIHQI